MITYRFNSKINTKVSGSIVKFFKVKYMVINYYY